MEYLGNLAPFYISRHRLRLLSSRAEKHNSKLSGKITVPYIGELQIDYETVDPATGALLENSISWLTYNQAIGDIEQSDYEYCWVWMSAKISKVVDTENGVDHIVAASHHANSPSDWKCILIGSRVNLTSLAETSVPSLGSSPLAIQAAIQILHEKNPPTGNTCQQLSIACKTAVEEPSVIEWDIAGVVEILRRCKSEKLVLGAPLFLTYYPAL